MFRVLGIAAVTAASLCGGMALAVQDTHRCLVRVERAELPGTFALTRQDLVDGGCVCLLRTGPVQKQPEAIELQIKTLQGSGACSDALRVGASNIQFPGDFRGNPSSTGSLARNGSLLGGLLALVANAPSFANGNRPDSNGG